jgi:hypothetical protein
VVASLSRAQQRFEGIDKKLLCLLSDTAEMRQEMGYSSHQHALEKLGLSLSLSLSQNEVALCLST